MEERKKSYLVPSIVTFILAAVLVVLTILGFLEVAAYFGVDSTYLIGTNDLGLSFYGWAETFVTVAGVIEWVIVGISVLLVVFLVIALLLVFLKCNGRIVIPTILTIIATVATYWAMAIVGLVNSYNSGFTDYFVSAISFDSSVADLAVSVYFIILVVVFVATLVALIVTYICLYRAESYSMMAGQARKEYKEKQRIRRWLKELAKRGIYLKEEEFKEETPKRKVVLSLKRHLGPCPNGEEFNRPPAIDSGLSIEDVRRVLHEELSGAGYGVDLEKDDVRYIVKNEIRDVLSLLKLKRRERVVIKEEVKEEVEEEVEENEPTDQNIEVHVEAPEVVQAPVVEVQTEEVDSSAPVKKVERVSFSRRILEAGDDIREHYNNLKSLLVSYGLNSRIANGGDTFRLHRVTYCKIAIAGKALKLYLALDPQDYANTTLPIKDSSSKAIYKDIPLTFKVKSELSYRRAEQLIRDCMEKHNVEQIDQVYAVDWASKVEEEANLTDDFDE